MSCKTVYIFWHLHHTFELVIASGSVLSNMQLFDSRLSLHIELFDGESGYHSLSVAFSKIDLAVAHIYSSPTNLSNLDTPPADNGMACSDAFLRGILSLSSDWSPGLEFRPRTSSNVSLFCKYKAIGTITEVNLRRVRLVSTTAEGEVGPVLRQFPRTDTSLHDPVHGWGSINHVGQPRVPNKPVISAFQLQFYFHIGGILTSRARSARGHIPSPCSRPIVCGLRDPYQLAGPPIQFRLLQSPTYGEVPPRSSRSTCCRTGRSQSMYRPWYHLSHRSVGVV